MDQDSIRDAIAKQENRLADLERQRTEARARFNAKGFLAEDRFERLAAVPRPNRVK